MAYLIWSIEHTAWWRAHRNGYTRNLHEAGHYDRAEAQEIVADANIVQLHECLIPVAAIGAAPELLAAARLAVDVIGNTRDEFGLQLEAEKAYLSLSAALAKATAEDGD